MFEEGNLLFFRPFLFKNGAEPQDKFFLVLKKLDGDILLASLPTSKDHVPSDLEVKHGCLNISERMAQTTIEKIGTLDEVVFTELVACLSESKMVKNKYRKILKS